MEATKKCFPSEAESMEPVRTFVAEFAGGHPCAADFVTVVNEITTNAFQHTGCPEFWVHLARSAEMLHVAVAAAAITLSTPHIASPEGAVGRQGGERGRGLFIVDALCANWGTSKIDGRQVVFATLTPEHACCGV